jgi:hypothetical protein
MGKEDHDEIPSQGDFWSQVPVVLFTVAAVVAIFMVNTHAPAVAQAATAAVPAAEIPLDPVDCADCGEVIAVRAAPAEEVGSADETSSAFLIDVRMTDGSIRTVKESSPGFNVGDRVQVNGNALVARS